MAMVAVNRIIVGEERVIRHPGSKVAACESELLRNLISAVMVIANATGIEIADDRHRLRTAGLHQIVQNPIDDRFVKRSFVAIRPKVKLE